MNPEVSYDIAILFHRNESGPKKGSPSPVWVLNRLAPPAGANRRGHEMSSYSPEDLSPGQFRPSRGYVIAAAVLILAAGAAFIVQPLLALRGSVGAPSSTARGGPKPVDAVALPRRNLLGSLFVIGSPAPAAKAEAAKPAEVLPVIDEAPAVAATETAPELPKAAEAAPAPAAAPAPPPAPEPPISNLPPF